MTTRNTANRKKSMQADASHSESLHKQGLIYFCGAFVVAAFFWSGLYFFLGFRTSAVIPGGYGLLSFASLIFVLITGRYVLFRFFQFVLILVLPVLLQLSLGGFINSGAVMIWAILCPLGALSFAPTRQALFWFALYFIACIFSGLAEIYLPLPAQPMPAHLRLLFFVMNITAVSTMTFASLFYFITQSRREHDRAENLLLNILPEPIARRLKKNPQTIADKHAEVTIVFADIVGFTSMSSKVPPDELVAFLNGVFSHFDTLADAYGLEKIKTIGDAYMVVSGLPVANAQHAENAVQMAIDMKAHLRQLRDPTGKKLNMRIGIHSGPVVAGVIGRRKFIYDLWGDSVNTASRMESHGLPGKIHISEQTYRLIAGKYPFRKRGMIDMKGKGKMLTYFL